MKELAQKPFLTKDFSPRGGGIDFLGLRWVNLEIVGSALLPEINNVTRDMGTFFLGAWIPWKFKNLIEDKRECTEENYRRFREGIEVAMSFQFKREPEFLEGLSTRNKIGNLQEVEFPCDLLFESVKKRSAENSIYAAALYGPAIVSLGFVESYRIQSENSQRPLNVPMPAEDDAGTMLIVQEVDSELQQAGEAYSQVVSLNRGKVDEDAVQSLGEVGLSPAYWRLPKFRRLKKAFRTKLLPKNPKSAGHKRTLTARLLHATLQQREGLLSDEIRNAWYTGMFDDGTPLVFDDESLTRHKDHWAFFVGRQYQRYALESFLYCFEIALRDGGRSIEDVVLHWMKEEEDDEEPWPETFEALLHQEARKVSRATSDDKIAADWNRFVHPGHKSFEAQGENHYDWPCYHSCLMLAGWFWRLLGRLENTTYKELLSLGGSDRMSAEWLLEWLQERLRHSMRDFLRDVFSDLVFSQHIRVALSRFDGQAQRLRFMLGDSGIEPTLGVSDIGDRGIPWMPDRLDTFIDLLCDCDVLQRNETGLISLGEADYF